MAATHGMQPIWLQQYGASVTLQAAAVLGGNRSGPVPRGKCACTPLLSSPEMDGCIAISSDRCADRKIDTRFGS